MYAGVPAMTEALAERDGLREAEVHELHHARGGAHHVRGLHVAVDDLRAVGVLQGLEHLRGDPQGLDDGEPPLGLTS
jgi:hypothetical protein